MKKIVYALLGIAVLVVAGFMISRALNTSLVYFVLPNEYAKDPGSFDGRRIRLGGLVEPGSMHFNPDDLQLTFRVTDSIKEYPVSFNGAPPDLFEENGGVVIEGRFQDGVFHGDNLLVKHSEDYKPPAPGEAIDVDALKDSLQ